MLALGEDEAHRLGESVLYTTLVRHLGRYLGSLVSP